MNAANSDADTRLPPKITSYVGAVKHVPPGDETRARRAKTDAEGRQNLANLRRVNKLFRRCATPLLFRHISATVYGLVRLHEVSMHPALAAHVRHVDVGVGRARSLLARNTRYAEDLAGLLGPCLARLPHLASLDFVVGGKASLRELPPKLNDALVKALASALLYVELPGLRELDLSFPIARDFEQLAHADDEPRSTRVRLGPRVLGEAPAPWFTRQGVDERVVAAAALVRAHRPGVRGQSARHVRAQPGPAR
ncbi:uncharacterized protein PG986_008749 [Apiospora aurea]|uniref:Uncharacterized protein n=1 Tax=Apiospora aurea TaxID=335848 RepID=A0ABR1Q5X7_9PEZI